MTSLSVEHGNLTTMGTFEDGGAVVCTAGESGEVGVWDLRAGKAVVGFEGEFFFFSMGGWLDGWGDEMG